MCQQIVTSVDDGPVPSWWLPIAGSVLSFILATSKAALWFHQLTMGAELNDCTHQPWLPALKIQPRASQGRQGCSPPWLDMTNFSRNVFIEVET